MAGLQQYNFFPTDLFYPRPQPSAATLDAASGKPVMLPLQNQKGEIISAEDLQQRQPGSLMKVPPSTSALVYSQKKQSVSGVDKKQSKFSTNPLSWLVWIEEEEGLDAF